MSTPEQFRKEHAPAMCLQTDSWTHPPRPRQVLELLDHAELLEQKLELVKGERDRWKEEATKFGKAFQSAARVLRAIDFTPAHLGKDSASEPNMWMSWARGVIRVWNENKEDLIGHLDGTSN